MSLDARMQWALGSAVVLSFLLVLATLFTTGDIDRTNLLVRVATSDLREQNAREAALRDLRTAIGVVTRRAERGEPVTPREAAVLQAKTYGSALSVEGRSRGVAAGLAEVERRTGSFGESARNLLQAARGSREDVGTRLPDYLRDLKALEEAQTRVRHALARDADAASIRNLQLLRRWQAAFTGGALLLITIVAALAYWVRRDVVAPIRRLNDLLRSAAPECGDADESLATMSEVGALAAAVSALQCVLAEREDAVARLEVTSRHDALTGLSNRSLFDSRLPAALTAAEQAGEDVALICIDIDRFKEINDALGHGEGDEVLRQVATMLRDVCDDETVSRIGGDEFTIIQTGKDQPAAAKTLIGRLMKAMDDYRLANGVSASISVGAAIYPRDGESDQVLRHHADLALYRAKHDGRGRACFFGALETTPLEGQGTGASSLALELPAAIRTGELAVAYQPKLHARTNQVTSAEALVRWNHPTRGQVQPNDFISIAEQTGQIRALTEWMLRRTIADQAWLAARGQEVELHVNISAPLLGDADFADALLRIAADRTGVIGLEITETAIIDDPQSTLAHLHRFVDAGLKIAIDDYGAGWSSLSYLKQLPAHELKIDRAFISDISRSHRDPLLVRSTIDLAHALGMEVTAEGVDTGAALALLKVMGCDLIQGFLVSKPLTLDALAEFLADDASLAHLDRMPLEFGSRPGAAPKVISPVKGNS